MNQTQAFVSIQPGPLLLPYYFLVKDSSWSSFITLSVRHPDEVVKVRQVLKSQLNGQNKFWAIKIHTPSMDHILCFCNNLAQGWDRRWRYQEAPNRAWRASPQIRPPEAVHWGERGWPTASKCLSWCVVIDRAIRSDSNSKKREYDISVQKRKSLGKILNRTIRPLRLLMDLKVKETASKWVSDLDTLAPSPSAYVHHRHHHNR